MRLTRTATTALLDQRQGGHLEPSPPSRTIDILPEDVLLEIFDSCRQIFEHEHCYEWTWNGKDGWFKLAHVCRKWRCVVFSSSSRLHLRLLFTSRRPPRAVMLTRLPPLPIVVQYRGVETQAPKEENGAAAALRYPNRTCGIAIRGSLLMSDGVYRAMNRPFPILENFELLHEFDSDEPAFEAPTAIFKGSAPSLRRLILQNISFASVSQLLSSTTGLVELHLDTDTIDCLPPAESLLTHLQGMPCLRRLWLWVQDLPPPTTDIPVFPMTDANVVPLLKLTHFQFFGSTTYFEALAAGLAAPFVQDLEIQFNDGDDYSPSTFPHLSRFIGDVEGQFFAIRVDVPRQTEETPWISMLTHSHTINEPPRRIAIASLQNEVTWTVQIGTPFGARLTTAEQLFFTWPSYNRSWFDTNPIGWRGFFEQFQNVKILRMGRDFLLEVARFLLLNSGEPPLLLLPALEEIVLHHLTAPSVASPISDIGREEVFSTFRPFIAARQRVGHPVRISWEADSALRSPYW